MHKEASVPRDSAVSLGWSLILVALPLAATPAHAQAVAEPPVTIFRFGDIGLNPALNVVTGYDTNAIRAEEPVPSSEITVVGQVESFWNIRRYELRSAAAVESMNFPGQPNEAGVNYQGEAELRARGVRISPTGLVRYRNISTRPTGFEVGPRSRFVTKVAEGGVAINISERLGIDNTLGVTRVDYDADARFQDSSLTQTLNFTVHTFASRMVFELTPLTAVRTDFTFNRERFDNDPARDNTNFEVLTGVMFEPLALIEGRAQVGVERFNGTNELGTFNGLTLALGLSYRRNPRIGVIDFGINRGTEYSFDETQLVGTVLGYAIGYERELGQRWMTDANLQIETLDYPRPRDGLTNERRISYGGNVAFRLSQWQRVGVQVDRQDLSSSRVPFNAFRVIAFYAYGEGSIGLERPTGR